MSVSTSVLVCVFDKRLTLRCGCGVTPRRRSDSFATTCTSTSTGTMRRNGRVGGGTERRIGSGWGWDRGWDRGWGWGWDWGESRVYSVCDAIGA